MRAGFDLDTDAPERGGRGAAIAGLIFFGPAGAAMLWSAMKAKAFPQRARTRSRSHYLIVPAVLLVILPGGALKVLFALPLLLAWLLLFARYESRRAVVVAASAVAAIAVGQALVFAVSVASAIGEAADIRGVVLEGVFALLVVALDAQVLWAVRKRLREATAGTPG